MMAAPGAGLLLAATAVGLGALVLGPPRNGELRAGWAGAAFVAGAALAAAVLNVVGLLGPPHLPVLLAAWGAAAWGWGRLLRARTGAGPGLRVEAACTLPVLALSTPALLLAVAGPSGAYDWHGLWWPKVLEVARGGAPDLTGGTFPHMHPEYPRGLAWLTLLACPDPTPGSQVGRLVTALFLPAAALLMLRGGELAGARTGGLLAALLLLALPGPVAQAPTGQADVPLGAVLLLVGVGLTELRAGGPQGARGALAAAAAAAGAAAFKEEGLVVALAAGLLLVPAALKGRLRARTALALLLAVVGPWVWARAGVQGPRAAALETLAANPGMLAARLAELPGALADLLVEPGGLFLADRETVYEPSPVLWALMLAGLVLLPRGRRALVVVPAGLLLLAQGLAVALTHMELGHQLQSAGSRLAVQTAPLLLAAAALRILPRGRREPEAEGTMP